jgi:Restriction endonuclease
VRHTTSPQHRPVPHRSRSVEREVSQLTPTGFEAYVADRFQSIPGWSAQVTPRSRDQGADVLLTAPDAQRYLIQCKLVTTSVGSPEAQRTGGAASFYQVPLQNAVLLSALPNGSRETAFTAEARRYADTTGLRLWTLASLQVVADADAAGTDAPLAALGLPVTTLPARPRDASSSAILGTGAVLVIGILLAVLARIATTSAHMLAPPVDEQGAITRLLSDWEGVYRSATITNDAGGLEAYIAGAELEALATKLRHRRALGCRLEIEQYAPAVVESVSLETSDVAHAVVRETTRVRDVCVDGHDAVLRDGIARVTYVLAHTDGGWRITSSTTHRD